MKQFIFALLLGVTLSAEEKPNPLQRIYASTPDATYRTMGRAIASKGWKILHTDKDLCLITFQIESGFWGKIAEDISENKDNTASVASCEPMEDGTRVTVKRGPKSWLSGRQDRKFAERMFKEFEQAGLK